MSLEIREVVSKRDLRDFVYLPAKIHAGHKNWVPPIYMDEFSFFNPRKNKSFNYSKYIMLLAYRDGNPVGRIMGLINLRYNERKNENNARFSYFETYDDQEVAHALIEAVEQWARREKADRLIGPLGFSDKEPMGMMVEGFEHPIVLVANANLPYQVKLLENEGFTEEVKLLGYLTEVPDETPEIYKQILPRIDYKLNGEFTMVEFTSRRELRKYIYPVLHLTNRAFDHIYGSMPYEEHEMKEFANRFIWLLNPKLVKLIKRGRDEVVAYVVGMPDITPGIIRARGRLFPFGIFKIFRASRKTDRITMLLGAVDEPYRGRGLDVWMALKMMESAREVGKKYLDSHMVLESNTAMRAEYERVGGKIYKKYLIYQKKL